MITIPSDSLTTGSVTNRLSGMLQTLANTRADQLDRLGTEIKAIVQNVHDTEYSLCGFDFPSQELIFAAVYNSAEYCRFENLPPDPLATEAGKFVLLGSSANKTDAHSLLSKQFNITRTDSKTLGLSTLYSSGVTSCCNLLRPSLQTTYTDRELKNLVQEYHLYFKGKKERGDHLYTGGLFSHFFNYIQWLISQPVPRLPFGNQAITNTLRPEHCGKDYFTSRANWPVQGMGAYLLDCMGYEIDKKIFEQGLEDFIWYQMSCHDELIYMCHKSAIDEWVSITKTAYRKVWTKFFAAFDMTCPEQVFLNLELSADSIYRKSPNTNVCTVSGQKFLASIAPGFICS